MKQVCEPPSNTAIFQLRVYDPRTALVWGELGDLDWRRRVSCRSMGEMLLKLDELCENWDCRDGYAQSGGLVPLDCFYIHMYSRQHSGIHGWLLWSHWSGRSAVKKESCFRSGMELLKLIESAVGKAA